MIRVFTGHDPREEVGTWTFMSSVLHHASVPVMFMPLHKPVLSEVFGQTFAEGTNAFTVARFLVPALCDFSGRAIFADGADMVMRRDIAEMADMFDDRYAVQVVKHDYVSRHPIKYRGTKMQAANSYYARKNWASLMLLNCSHPAWRDITPSTVAKMPVGDLLQFKFLPDELIGELPIAWNWLADEYGEHPDAMLCHWTAGVPGFPAYKDAPMAGVWKRAHDRANHATD